MADETKSKEPKEPVFSFEKVAEFTEKVQYRVNDMASVEAAPFGTFLRGEVKHIKSERGANNLVRGGLFAHVPADTPTGQPAEYAEMDKKKTKPTPEPLASGATATASEATTEPVAPLFERSSSDTTANDNEV